MKRTVAIILLLATVFGFCAFGGAAPSADAAPAGEIDAAEVKLATKSDGSEVVKIKITKDNFLDYFKYKSNCKDDIYTEKNSKGKVVYFSYRPGYVLKDGYRIVYEYGEYESEIEVGVKYKTKWYYPAKKNVKIDFSKLTYKVTGKARLTSKEDEMLEGYHSLNDDDEWTYYIPLGNSVYMTYKKGWGCQTVSKKSIEIISVKGTLYLYADSIPDSDT